MDLEKVLENKNEEPFNKPCLYIIQPNLPGKPAYRCGVSGTLSQALDPTYGSKPSTLASRVSTYYGNWIHGGKLHACLVIPTAFKGRLIGISESGEPIAKVLERAFHQELDKSKNVKRLRSEKSEWFGGPLEEIKNILSNQAGIEFFDFVKGKTSRDPGVTAQDAIYKQPRHSQRKKEDLAKEVCDQHTQRARKIREQYLTKKDLREICNGDEDAIDRLLLLVDQVTS